MHGGQSIPNFDYAMAPGGSSAHSAKATGGRWYSTCKFPWKRAAESARRCSPPAEEAIAQIRMGKADAVIPALCEAVDLPAELLQAAHRYAVKKARQETENATYQAMEALIHNLNTMTSRAGAQVPFSTVNYGTDTSPEGRMVIQNLLLATEKGLGDGSTPGLPGPNFQSKKMASMPIPATPNYDLFRQAMQVSGLRLYPNFSFLDAPFKPAILPARRLPQRSRLSGLPHPRDGKPPRPQPPDVLPAGGT